MSDKVEIELQVGGVKQVEQAFKSVAQALNSIASSMVNQAKKTEEAERRMTRAAENRATKEKSIAEDYLKNNARINEKRKKYEEEFSQWLNKELAKRESAEERAAKSKERRINAMWNRIRPQLEKDDAQFWKKLDSQNKAWERVQKNRKARQAREAAEVEKLRNVSKEERINAMDRRTRRTIADEIAAEKAAEEFKKSEEKKTQIAKDAAKKRADEEARIAKQKHDKLISDRKQNADRYAGAISGAFGNVVNRTVTAAGYAAVGASAYFGTKSVKDRLEQERMARQLSVEASALGGPMIDHTKLQANARQISEKYNIDQKDIFSAQVAYVRKYQDASGLAEMTDHMAKLSKITGTPLEDLMNLSGRIKSLDKKNPLSTNQVKEMLTAIAAQGYGGALSIEDIASQGGKILSIQNKFGYGSPQKVMTDLFALGQTSISGSVGGAQALSSVEAITSDLVQKAPYLKQYHPGLYDKIFDKKGMLKAPADFIPEIIAEADGSPLVLSGKRKQTLGINKLAMRTFGPLTTTFNEAAKNGDEAAGIKAVRDRLLENENARMSPGDMQNRLEQIMNGSAERFEAASKRFENVLGDKLIGPAEKLINSFTNLDGGVSKTVDGFISLAEKIVNNPVEAALMGLAAYIGGSVIQTAISTAFKEAIASAIMAAGGAGAFLSISTAVGAAIVAGIALGNKLYNQGREADNAALVGAGGMTADVNLLRDKLASGKISPEQAEAERQSMQAKYDAAVEKTENPLYKYNPIGRFGMNMVADMFPDSDFSKSLKESEAIASSQELAAQLKGLAVDIANVRGGIKDQGGGVPFKIKRGTYLDP